MRLVPLAIALLALAAVATASASPARAVDPVIAAAGDISCDALPTTPDFCQQQATSDLLTVRPLAAPLALGDNQYEDGSLPSFLQYYDPTWARLKPITRPAVGNHEYRTVD